MIKNIKCTEKSTKIALFISGDLTEKNCFYDEHAFDDREDMEKILFSVYDEHERKNSKQMEEGCGFRLSAFLQKAGAQAVDEIRLKCMDGYEAVVPELMSPRYYFPGLPEGSEAGRERRGILLSFFKNGERVKAYPHPTIMFGQQGINDKNKDYFAKGLRSIVAGGRDRAFWVKGDAMERNRYFGLDQLFELKGDGSYNAEYLEATMEDGSIRLLPAVKITEHFWKQELCMKDADAELTLVSGNDRVSLTNRSALYLFLADEDLKQAGAWDGEHIIEKLDGILAGNEVVREETQEYRIPQTKEVESDFVIGITDREGIRHAYCYSITELKDAYSDLLKELSIVYYNHNMDHGKGGMRRVTAHGWMLKDLLTLLPGIGGIETIEEGGLHFNVLTADGYKDRMRMEGNELTAFSYMLAFEHDQRTQTGEEAGDTSSWDDGEMHFCSWEKGMTPWRIYCDKNSAGPAVYKNVCGFEVKMV